MEEHNMLAEEEFGTTSFHLIDLQLQENTADDHPKEEFTIEVIYPNGVILRVYSRKQGKLKQQVTRVLTVMDSVLVKCGIRASSCLSSISSKSFLCIVEALIAGWSDPGYLVSLVYGNRKNKQSGKLKEALTGNLKAHHRQELSWLKQEYEMYQMQISECLSEMRRTFFGHGKAFTNHSRDKPNSRHDHHSGNGRGYGCL